MLVPTFKMEMAEIIRNSLTKGEWLVLIDLKDAYFHVPIHPDSQHLLCFHVDKRIANLISKLNFYKLIPYPMDNC